MSGLNNLLYFKFQVMVIAVNLLSGRLIAVNNAFQRVFHGTVFPYQGIHSF